jgi:hypothetical protein
MVTVRRSSADLPISCAKDSVTASATIASAPAQIAVAAGPFDGDTGATVPQDPGTIAVPAASDARATTARN